LSHTDHSNGHNQTNARSAFGRLAAKAFRAVLIRTPANISTEVAPASGWEANWSAAEAAFRIGQFPLAARHLAIAVEEGRAFGEKDPRLGRTLNRLGVVESHQEQYAQAERSLKAAAAASMATNPLLITSTERIKRYEAIRNAEASLRLEGLPSMTIPRPSMADSLKGS